MQDAFATHLSASENARFLEQLRFTIVGSQLLSDRASNIGYKPSTPGLVVATNGEEKEDDAASHTIAGAIATLLAAFVVVWSVHWARPGGDGHMSLWRLTTVSLLLVSMGVLSYVLLKRQYTRYLRKTTLEAVSAMITNAQVFNTAAATASTLVQEVEVVSRGYQIGSPLPPASRLEDNQAQVRRCARLRRALQSSLGSLLVPFAEAFVSTRPLVNESDLDQYFDIYEISRSDIAEADDVLALPNAEPDGDESLKAIRIKTSRLHTLRKLYLCSMLALDGTNPHFVAWASVTSTMDVLSQKSAASAATLDRILSEEQSFPTPLSPKSTTTPQRNRLQGPLRRFAALSQGLRGLQAKMHILREESDRSLNSSEEVSDLGSNLLEHYDAIGTDLKSLMEDWKEGRAALAANIDKNERRVSQISSGAIFSSPTTPVSLGGLTAVEETSPLGALKALNGEGTSSLDASGSDEEVFEAVALPRPRSTMTREERLAKVREERARQSNVRERADASQYILKELETVIKMRPRSTTTGGRRSMPA